MKRTKFKNKFNEERNAKYWYNYKQRQNYSSNLFREPKLRHFNNLSVKDVTENKHFWKTIKPFFTDKTRNSNNIILIENDQTIREDEKIFNICFTNATKGIKLQYVDKTQLFKNEESCS